ncbi:hypothetical protein BGZ47_009659 [Haplosporangium gracile]|nr:hypothetical protein BGZ47_009659 [Haplosporangium gracile]
MGRQLEVPFGNYEKNVSSFVDNTRTVLQSQFHDLETDVHIIPIEWHAKLHSMVDERMALTSLRTVPKVRLVMNDYMADILYYFNPHFGSQIVKMIVEELNEAYDTFMEKHPDFNGKISVYALSLGGVAMFDILTCQDDDELEDPSQPATTSASTSDDQEGTTPQGEEEVQERPAKKARVRKQDQSKFRAVIPKLKFRPEYLFTVGSPVGAVMVMRNLDWDTFHPPDDIIHHNLFHPFDPLGYRLEPLIDPIFAGVPAAVISSYQSQLFPSLSLPSLPSLQLPESISAFWENRVPTLPRPSIPTLSSISLMTQSLKAGRWLPGSGSSKDDGDDEEEGSVSSQDSDSEDHHHQKTSAVATATSTTPAGASSPATSVSNSDAAESSSKDVKKQEQPDTLMDGGDASVSEFMGAATAATYLEQTEDPSNSRSSGVARPADVAAIKAQNDTTTESPQKGGRQPPARRLSLGPHRISSRVEDDEQQRGAGDSATTAGAKRTMLDVAEESFIGMEDGGAPATAQEKALGAGAKSDVIQESIVRSMPEGGSSNNCNSGASINAGGDAKIEAEDNTANRTRKNVHVEGRATKLPYRIDHVLQETTVDQYTNEYLLGMRSHFKYWGNRDVAYHILRTMLSPVDPEADKEVLDLKLNSSVPPPSSSTTTNTPKEAAAEAKAKTLAMVSSTGRAAGRATAATMRSRSGTTGSASDSEVKKQNRMSFSFSFFSGGQSNSSTDDVREQQSEEERRKRRERQEAVDEDLAMMDEEGELFGCRYLDADSSSKASAGTTTKTLFQSSPWSSKRSDGDGAMEEDTSCTWTTSTTMTTTATTRTSGTKRRISVERKASSTVGTTSSTAFVAVAKKNKGGDGESSESGGDGEDTVVVEMDVPELARPAKLHHRAARVEE